MFWYIKKHLKGSLLNPGLRAVALSFSAAKFLLTVHQFKSLLGKKKVENQPQPSPVGLSDTAVSSSGTSDLLQSFLDSKCVSEMMLATQDEDRSVVFYSGVSRRLPFSSQVHTCVCVYVCVRVCVGGWVGKEETQGDSCHHRFSTQQ